LTIFLTSALLLGAFSALAVVLEALEVAAALEPVDVAELDLDLLAEALLAALDELAAAEEAPDELALVADAEDALDPELEAEMDSTVLVESITNCGV